MPFDMHDGVQRIRSMTPSEYNRGQRDTILAVRHHLARMPESLLRRITRDTAPYLAFRRRVSRFQQEHFSGPCSFRCFSSHSSACCGREGIFTFFADLVVDLLLYDDGEAERLLSALDSDRGGANCVYLGEEGCLWALKPIVCEMFLCEHVKEHLLGKDRALKEQWAAFRREEKLFTYPDRPVLFDSLESVFLEAGCESPLMYFHRSPGLVRLKEKHGVGVTRRPGRPSPDTPRAGG